MEALAAIKTSFFVECTDLLELVEENTLRLQDGNTDPETLNAVFRAVHSIKGGAGAFGLDALVDFAHRFESVLDALRTVQRPIDGPILLLILRTTDALSDLVAASRDNTPHDSAAYDESLITLETHTLPDTANAPPGVTFTPRKLSVDLPLPADSVLSPGTVQEWEISFRTCPSLGESGNEPLFILRALAELGALRILCDTTDLPRLKVMDPTRTYLHWTLSLTAPVTKAAIREVFEFVEGICSLTINRATAVARANILARPVPHPTATGPAKMALDPARTVRVDLDRIDRLVNLVGELVINQSMLTERLTSVTGEADIALGTDLEALRLLTRDIQDSVMAIRAQPVKHLFQRMSRILREAAAGSDKQVRLVLVGETTEIDKTVIDRLADPLTHMIRNAVDHGLETADGRLAAGKPIEGTIYLRAAHRSGRVVIEIEDDGAGIDRDRVVRTARDRGLITPHAQPSDSEIDALLLLPGFSTAPALSNLSGRGVGMDVVKRAIHAQGGRLTIRSSPGTGTLFSISLPLTLAVLDGMEVAVAGQTVVVPMASLVETQSWSDADIQTVARQTQVVRNRGAFVPLFDLGEEFGYRNRSVPEPDAVILFLLAAETTRFALVVDAIHAQRQVVIKGLSDSYGYVPGVSGATILGDGRIALILDPFDLIARKDRTAVHPTLSLAG